MELAKFNIYNSKRNHLSFICAKPHFRLDVLTIKTQIANYVLNPNLPSRWTLESRVPLNCGWIRNS